MSEGTKTLLNLTLQDIAKITLQAALVIAVIVLWSALQKAGEDYRMLSQSCAKALMTLEAPAVSTETDLRQ